MCIDRKFRCLPFVWNVQYVCYSFPLVNQPHSEYPRDILEECKIILRAITSKAKGSAPISLLFPDFTYVHPGEMRSLHVHDS